MGGALRVVVYVHPRSRRTAIVGAYREGLKIQVIAPPVDGAANEAVIDLVAGTLGVPRRTVCILQGAGARRKVVEIADADTPERRQQLDELLSSR
jgi:hypothetical protein